MSPAGGGKGVVCFNTVIIFISYMLSRLNPPPSLRDTSASGGHEMANSAIATQSLKDEDSKTSSYAATFRVPVAGGITSPLAWQANRACPALRMFIAAFTSASSVCPQAIQMKSA